MKNIEIIKDLIISILIVICIVVALSMFFYDKISLTKIIPESEEYLLTEEMQESINDDSLEEIEEVVTKYYIDAADLKKYEKTKEYNKGKKNPFSATATSPDASTNSNSSNSSNADKNDSEHFYEDDGTK